MDYQIVLSPELKVSAADFAAAWNELPDCQAMAEAQPTKVTSQLYTDPALEAIALVTSSMMLGVASNLLTDLIKQALSRRGVQKPTEVVELPQPDGTKIIVIKIKE